MTNQKVVLARQRLRTPRAAAVAGILFAVLFIISVVLIRLVLPEDLTESSIADWLGGNTALVSVALTLVPFAGIAFLWFMGVVRAHLGKLEDQFFSSVLVGSGLLFLAMTFASAAIAGGIIASYAIAADQLADRWCADLWASADVYDHECLCHSHGRRVYDFAGHHLASGAGSAAPVCVCHLRPGAAVAGHHQFFAVGDSDLSGLGLCHQHVYLA